MSARTELDRGPVAAAMPLDRMVGSVLPHAAQQTALDQLLAEQQDPGSRNYHEWLTPEEFGDRFGLAQADIDLVSAWLTAQGFTVQEVARSRTWIAFTGIAAQVEAAFHTPLDKYLVNGTLHYAPSTAVAVPEALSGVVSAVTGLHDFRPHVRSHARRASPRLTSKLSGNHYLAPGDFGTIYNLPDYVNGVISARPRRHGPDHRHCRPGQQQRHEWHIRHHDQYRCHHVSQRVRAAVCQLGHDSGGISPKLPQRRGRGSQPRHPMGRSNCAERRHCVCLFQNALTNSLQYLVNQNVASVISLSYGDCEANIPSGELSAIESYLSQANAQGQTVTAAAGDIGAAGCDGTPQSPVTVATHGLAVDYPASSMYVTAMGGTEFTGDDAALVNGGSAQATQYWDASSDTNNMNPSAFSYIPETPGMTPAPRALTSPPAAASVSSSANLRGKPARAFPATTPATFPTSH